MAQKVDSPQMDDERVDNHSEQEEVLYESDEIRNLGDPEVSEGEADHLKDLPVIPLQGLVVYPYMWIPLTMGQPRSLRIIRDNMPTQRHVVLVASQSDDQEPGPDEISGVGVVAVVHKVMRAPDGVLRVLVRALDRVRVTSWSQLDPYLRAEVEAQPETVEEGEEMTALARLLRNRYREYAELDRQTPSEVAEMALDTRSPLQFTYLIAGSLPMDVEQSMKILGEDSTAAKMRIVLGILDQEIKIMELGQQIQSQAQGEMERSQREFFLREQMKVINKELGDEDDQMVDIKELEASIAEANMLPTATEEATRELNRLRRVPIQAAEYSVIKSYIETLVGLPWNNSSSDSLDLRRARRVLNEDHYGLTDIKSRILEYLAVRKLRQTRRSEQHEEVNLWDKIRREREGVVLCFVGPPGVGKTSLGISIARAMKRQFVRLALGGVRDEAEIRGFRRTYVGAMPGRIIQNLRRCGTNNPVFMLDEVDKLGSDFRGDPSSALLEVLDPEQNREFNDHYLDVPFDLSNVMFITTANMVEAIPLALADRMEIIQLSSYTEEEKVKIAQNYLLPRQIRENGLHEDEISFTKGALQTIVRGYTNEAGVRELERNIAKLCRRTATDIATGSGSSNTRVRKNQVMEHLGKPKYHSEQLSHRTDMPGVATGLAWTMTGGDVLFIESIIMPGEQAFQITGQLGDVMRESGQAALSFIRSRARDLGIEPGMFSNHSIHVHIPAGSIPKDGPSAGITMATSLASLLTRRPVRKQVGMTGEITLRGKVLPVGGVKEKVLAAERLGLTTILLPRRNEADLSDIPDAIRRKLKFVLVDDVDQVLEASLEPNVDTVWVSRAKRDPQSEPRPLPLDLPLKLPKVTSRDPQPRV